MSPAQIREALADLAEKSEPKDVPFLTLKLPKADVLGWCSVS